jgi:coniferyl-aldehyde dehydrogenase
LAPDYVFVPEQDTDKFVEAARSSVSTMFADLKDNPDYTSIINKRHFDRLQGYLDEARSEGAEVIELNPANENFDQQEHLRIPPTLVINPPDHLQVMQEEIFGPILPVKSYSEVDETLDYINQRDRPLGLYYFGHDREEEAKVLSNTTSGGVTINDVIMHIAQEELPFGGVGPSGMGVYHGYDGFKNFSHGKAVYWQSTLISKLASAFRPPYKS